MSTPKRLSDPEFTPNAIVILWMICALWAVVQQADMPHPPHLSPFDLNHDGRLTISDVWHGATRVWLFATCLPIALLFGLLLLIAPGLVQFLELDAAMAGMPPFLSVVFGLALWIGLMCLMFFVEARVGGLLEAREERRTAAKLEAVRRGERARFRK